MENKNGKIKISISNRFDDYMFEKKLKDLWHI